jgi:predicted cobalt transporter CbtA
MEGTSSAFPATKTIEQFVMVRTLLVRGMLVGVIAGMLCFGFLKVCGEPQVDRAIAFETQQDVATGHNPEGHAQMSDETEPLVSRSVQAGLGLFTAVLVYSAAFGGLFGLAYAFACGRVPGKLTPRRLSAVLAAAGFISICLVPDLKYPANPPAVGEAETIGIRTALYFIVTAISLAAMILSTTLRGWLLPRFGEWNASLLAAGCYLAIVGIAALLLPVVDEVPTGFPAQLLWNFRVASVGAQLIMWTTLGLLFGSLTERAATSSYS